MENTEWVILDTETTGFSTPIFVVELAAQKMKGWKPEGPPFRSLLNHGTEIPPEAARVHGYTREILERDGDPPEEVYAAFAKYVGNHPLVAYNLPYDLDKVLLPEWRRMGIRSIGTVGFCALALTQRLLDPVPAGNCKLQTLRQYYRLPERGAHTALGDVETVIDLLNKVIRPLAEKRGLNSWEKICAFSTQAWYPRRIAFGKHKGRDFEDARDDADLRSWIEWLSESSNERSASMGLWYLSQLTRAQPNTWRSQILLFDPDEIAGNKTQHVPDGTRDLVQYFDPNIKKLQDLIQNARNRLAELSAEFMSVNKAVSATSAALFTRLKREYRRRDHLVLVINYRKRFLDTLLDQGEDEAESLSSDYQREKDEADNEYEEAVRQAAETKNLTDDERIEIRSIWKKLARMFHPDHSGEDPEQKAVHEKLFTVINNARDVGDIELLREISENPKAYMMRQGWDAPLREDGVDLETLSALYENVSLEVIQRIENLNGLKESNGYAILMFCQSQTDGFERLVQQHREMLLDEIKSLEAEAKRKAAEIEELLGRGAPI
jgi:DNA polymerase III epsilon subunit-like protein